MYWKSGDCTSSSTNVTNVMCQAQACDASSVACCESCNIFLQATTMTTSPPISTLSPPSTVTECSTNTSTAYVDVILLIDTSNHMNAENLQKVRKYDMSIICVI